MSSRPGDRRRPPKRSLFILVAFVVSIFGLLGPMAAYAAPTPSASDTATRRRRRLDDKAADQADAADGNADPAETPSESASQKDGDEKSAEPSASPSDDQTSEDPSPKPSESADDPTTKPSETDSPSPTPSTQAAEGGVTAQVVPPATGNDAVISVKVGGTRTGTTAVSSLAGVQLGFYDTADGNYRRVHVHLRQPTATARSRCRTRRLPKADSQRAPTATASSGCARSVHRERTTRTQALASTAPQTTRSAPIPTASRPARNSAPAAPAYRRPRATTASCCPRASTTTWRPEASGRTPETIPSFPAKCGINVALVLDFSNSVTNAQLLQLKAAANGFVDSLTGTPSQVGTFTFATNAPASTGDTLGLTSVSTAAGATTVKNKITNYTRPGAGCRWNQLGSRPLPGRPVDGRLRCRRRDHRWQPNAVQQPR